MDFQLERMGIKNDAAPEVEAKEVEEEPKVIQVKEAEEEAQEEESHDDKEAEEKGHKPNSKLQERFSKITKQREEARQEAATERSRVVALEARLAALEQNKPQNVAVDVDAMPKAEDFTDAFEYAQKLAKWSATEALKDRDRADVAAKQKAASESVVAGWTARLSAAKTDIPDFDEMVASSEVQVSNEVRDAIIESDVGPRILYHLAENEEDAVKLSGMTQGAALRFIGRLEAKYETAEKKEDVGTLKLPVKQKKAPEPINPISTSGAAGEGSDGENLDYAKYKALRMAGKIK
jgi:hypothetical protein